jgi:hypothetical protein
MDRGLKAQLKVFLVVLSMIKTKDSHCSQDFFQSTNKVGMVAVFTKFPQKVGDLYYRENHYSLFRRCCKILE